MVYKLRGPEEGGPNVEGIKGVESKYGHRVLTYSKEGFNHKHKDTQFDKLMSVL